MTDAQARSEPGGIMTYPEMNAKIVGLLRISYDPVDLYAAARIEELEAALAAVGAARQHPPSGEGSTVSAQRVCGNCRWWERAAQYRWGVCQAPQPPWAEDLEGGSPCIFPDSAFASDCECFNALGPEAGKADRSIP